MKWQKRTGVKGSGARQLPELLQDRPDPKKPLETQGVDLSGLAEGLPMGRLGALGGEFDVVLADRDAGMAHQVPDLVDAGPGFGQLGSKGMAKNVDRQVLGLRQIGPLGGFFDPTLEVIRMDGLLGASWAGEEIGAWGPFLT